VKNIKANDLFSFLRKFIHFKNNQIKMYVEISGYLLKQASNKILSSSDSYFNFWYLTGM